MSILTRPYVISLWEDIWDGEKFVEQRIAEIGSNEMTAQCRAIEPNLVTNVNGSKKFTFKMYKKYIDIVTGEEVDNPYVPWLISERKIKLFYKNKWHDFVIKGVTEDSTNYLNTYTLEDALVQELSKNGYGVVLSEENNNNSGSATELAARVLEDTNWTVSDKSEKFVQTLDENLVYLRITKNITAKRIDQSDLKYGIEIPDEEVEISEGTIVLGFYSCCKDKPYRFQFIYTDLSQINKDENRIITNSNCQYFTEYENPEIIYTSHVTEYDFYLPQEFSVIATDEDNTTGVVISNLYRGRKYVFAQQSIFSPQLNRYLNVYSGAKYEDSNGEKSNIYYGFQKNEYKSPALIQNLITNTDFASTSGWTATRYAESTNELGEVESVYGYFDNNKFVNGFGNLSNPKNKNYLRTKFKDSNNCLINSGPTDRRRIIGNIEKGDKFALKCEYKAPNNVQLNFRLEECVYDSTLNGYKGSNGNITFSDFVKEANTDYYICEVTSSKYSIETFSKSSQVRLIITASTDSSNNDDIYIENIELFKATFNEQGALITPESLLENFDNNIIETIYYYLKPEQLIGITGIEQLEGVEGSKSPLYHQYKPVYNEGAEKIRSISVKDSNYFNILQTIAETFECWLDFEIGRDDFGGITSKAVVFRNYATHTNYAGFKYGVNLKSIQRTYESKDIVTKLIVKHNSNEYAKNGYCTISRADTNPLGEDYIYDLQYYFNTGLLNPREFLDILYNMTGADQSNLQGYFPRLKHVNEEMVKYQEIQLNLSKDLAQYKANLEVANNGYEAAESGIEEVQIKYRQITNQEITNEIPEDFQERTDTKKLLQEYIVYNTEKIKYASDKDSYAEKVQEVEGQYNNLQTKIDTLKAQKSLLNKMFFSRYSRFINEGTWMDEEYTDDEKYYLDAKSVLYNSCYPKVAYSINIVELSSLPGYESFVFGLGDRTYVEDPDFFGQDGGIEIVVTEISEQLDDQSKDSLKVQNFKNQFQDLFQKITATVQETKYNTGSYEKAVALAEANQERKMQFLTDALDSADVRLAAAGQQSVVWGNDGITVSSVDTPSDAIRMIGGAILLSKQNDKGQTKWTTAITSDGVSASVITAGILNAGEISIMNYDEPVFRWDAFGISAYEATNYTDGDAGTVVSGTNPFKFVRFDKYGLYGVNTLEGGESSINGLTWHANSLEDIMDIASFALTWEGLKVEGKDGVEAIIGKTDDYIINITKGDKQVFGITSDGTVKLTGTLEWGDNPSPGASSNPWDPKNPNNFTGLLQLIGAQSDQGLYAANGKIYLNTEYILTGGIRFGGSYWIDPKNSDSVYVNLPGLIITNGSATFSGGGTFSGSLSSVTGSFASGSIGNLKVSSDGLYYVTPTTYDVDMYGLAISSPEGPISTTPLLGVGNFGGFVGSNPDVDTLITRASFQIMASGTVLSKIGVKNQSDDSKAYIIFQDSSGNEQGRIYKASNGLIINAIGGGWLKGTWYCNSSLIDDSSRNVKHDIESLPNNYSTLFDNLNPVRYKYNDSSSDRYHTGFILDELGTAIEKAGLTTQDCAAYCVSNFETGDGGIRYSEIISLNTWQIQMLKPRMTAVETEIISLKAKIYSLEADIQNLKNAKNSDII